MEVIRQLASEAERSMRDAGISDDYVGKLGETWRRFDAWLAERGVEYSPEAGDEFLAETDGSSVGMRRRRRRALAVLRNVHEHEPYRRAEDRRYESRFAACHEAVLNEFLDDVSDRYTTSTVCGYVYTLNRLSPYLEGRGVTDLADIGAEDVIGFLETVAEGNVGAHTVYATTSRLRRLLGWLESTGRADRGLAAIVPRAKAPAPEPPDTYTPEEVDAIVGAVDTASPTGRRDLVVCLLAARLGMRSSDIVGLRFEDVAWREGAIRFVSAKTGTPTTLPLTREVGDAIVAYVRDGRPDSDEPYVLLRHEAPHTRMRPSRVWGIVSAAMGRAGVHPGGRRRGPHALRASLATRMMDNDVPLPVISRALSHECSETSRHYLRADVEKLRECALDVPRLAGDTRWTGVTPHAVPER